MVVLAEQPVVGVHQLALAHGCGGLLGNDVAGLFDLQFADAQAGSRRRHDNKLMPGVLDIAPHLDQILGVADVEQPAGVCQRAGAYFNDDTHNLLLPQILRFLIRCQNGVGHGTAEGAFLQQAHALDG